MIVVHMLKFYARKAMCTVIALTLILVAGGNAGADNGTAEALFRRGLVRFNQGKYVSARLDFSEIVEKYKTSPRITHSYMLLSKTYYNIGDFDQAVSVASDLKRLYPKSGYAEWTDYIISACYFRQNKLQEALDILTRLAADSHDENVKKHSLRALRFVIQPAVDSDTFTAALSERGIKESDLDQAEPFDTGDNRSSFTLDTGPETQSVPPPQGMETVLRIGLLAPLTGVYSQQGELLLKGVKAAFDEKNALGDSVSLVVEDTESDQITAVLKTRALIEEGVVAIIGPVYGESTVTAAVEANASHIPFVAPTAQNSGLTEIGDYVFQLNLNPSVQAEALADFAVNTLGFSTVGIIATKDDWGEEVSEKFGSEVMQRGARVIKTALVDQNIALQDMNPVIMSFRDNAPESHALPESTIVIDNGSAFPDTIIVKLDPALYGPQRLVPIHTIDGILVSALAFDAILIAQHIIEYNISTILLGDSGWSSENIAEEGGNAVDGSYIVSAGGDYFGAFGSDYSSTVSDIISLKGYDALAIVLECLANGARNPEDIRTALQSLREYKGLSSMITIDPERRTNIAVDFIKIQNGTYIRIPHKSPVSGE
ncbi:penicillin-binding protein activator [bacterium]|nr:penicillin-binding protein activator [bacterium]